MCARTDRAQLTIGRTASWVLARGIDYFGWGLPREGWFGYAFGVRPRRLMGCWRAVAALIPCADDMVFSFREPKEFS